MFYSETEFQDTSFGSIPNDWEIVEIADAAQSIKRGPFGGAIKKEIFVQKGYKIYEQRNVIDNDFTSGRYFIDDTKFHEMKSFAINEEDILITGAGTIGKIAVVPKGAQPGIINQALIKITLDKKKIVVPYFTTLLTYRIFRNKVLQSSHGATMKNVSSVKELKSIEIPLPSLSEQRAIVGVLGDVDSAIEYGDRIIAKSERLKRGLMQQLLTRGRGHTETKQTPIGETPNDWKIVKIADVSSHVGSGLTPRGGSHTYLEKGIPLIRSQNVLMNKLDLSDVAYISQDTHEFMRRSVVYPGDVLLNITGASIGRVSVLPKSIKEANVNQHVCRIRLVKDVLPQFTAYYLSSPDGQKQIMSFQAGATRQGLNYQQMRAIQLPCPSIEEQKKIAEILSTVDLKIDTERKEKAILGRVKQGLMDLLLTGKVRIKEAA